MGHLARNLDARQKLLKIAHNTCNLLLFFSFFFFFPMTAILKNIFIINLHQKVEIGALVLNITGLLQTSDYKLAILVWFRLKR